MEAVTRRFLEYVRIDTRSVQPTPGKEQIHPSSIGQHVLADMLKTELIEMGVSKHLIRSLDDGSFLVFFPPIGDCEKAPHVVLAAHVDTYFGCPGGAKPILQHPYKDGDIHLPKDDVIIPASDLVGLEGKRIITASGDTLLGGDDKAGVAALMTLIESMLKCSYDHGPLTFWFCTDEEIGEVGVKFLPPGTAEKWDFLWTVDGERLDVVDIGCFYGSEMNLVFTGDQEKPAHYAACGFVAALAKQPTPWTTKGEESFLYVPALGKWTASESIVTLDPEAALLDADTVKHFADCAASDFGVKVQISDDSRSVKFTGNDAHPGVDGQKLKPAHYAACKFVHLLAMNTTGEQKTLCVKELPGECTAEKTLVKVYPRTFIQGEIPTLGDTIRRTAMVAAKVYDASVDAPDPKMLYVSTEVAIDAKRDLLQPGLDALKRFGIEAKLHRVRAGTDGAMLNMTYPNIPAPNFGTGGRNLHGFREFVVVDELELVPHVLGDMIMRYADIKR